MPSVMKKLLVIGGNGQLGQYLVKLLNECFANEENVLVVGVGRQQLDLENIELIPLVLAEYSPDLIINASAYTAVDKAESELELSLKVNAEAPKAIAKYAAEMGVPVIHYSTDYVFSGNGVSPYKEDDETQPQGQYGSSKLAGEKALLDSGAQVYIFRTAWVYSQKGANFYKTMLKLAETRSELNVVQDQLGSPTYAASIAQASVEVVQCLFSEKEYPIGVYHMTCGGVANWAEFAKLIFKEHGLQITVNGISSHEYPTPATRPSYSVLSNEKLKTIFGITLPDWKDALTQCVHENSKHVD
jgi:dTDP-4-dehydrorhamnose reductase